MFFGVKAVFFDIGGVVVDADLHAYADIGAQLFQADPEDIRRAAGKFVPDLETGRLDSYNFWKFIEVALWASGSGKTTDFPDFDTLWGDILKENATLNQEVMDIVFELRKNVKVVGVISNAIKEHVKHLKALGAYAAFHPLFISCDVGMRKPDADIYKMAAKEVGLWCRQCLFIDDLQVNVDAAKAVGMKAHLYTNPNALKTELRRLKLLS